MGELLYKDKVNNITTPNKTSNLMSSSDLANKYGITYDANAIESKFNEATKAEYDVLRKEYEATQNKFYNNMYNNQMTALDTIRKSNAEAISTGASRGVQAANELSSILGLQQATTEEATQLAVDRNALADKEAAAYAKNKVDAFNTANELGLSLGNLASGIYASDVQFDVAQLDYYARLDAAMKNLMGMQEQANANMYAADRDLEGVKYSTNFARSFNSGGYGGGYSGSGYGYYKNGVYYNSNGTKGTAKDAKIAEIASNTGIDKYTTNAEKIAWLTACGVDYDSAKKWVESNQNSGFINKVAQGTANGMTTEQAVQWANNAISSAHGGKPSNYPTSATTSSSSSNKTSSSSSKKPSSSSSNPAYSKLPAYTTGNANSNSNMSYGANVTSVKKGTGGGGAGGAMQHYVIR